MTRRTRLTVGELRDIVDAAATDIEINRINDRENMRGHGSFRRSGDDDYHLVDQLRAIAVLANEVIGASHIGCAHDEVILELGDDGDETVQS